MKRALALGLMLIATAVSAAEIQLAPKHNELRAPSRESLGQKTQWAPSGNFSALHGRAVFRGEFKGESRPYARARGEVASDIGIFLSRDSIGASSRLGAPNGMGPWSYAALSPARYTDPDGRWELDPGYSGERPSAFVQAEAFDFSYRVYRYGIQQAGGEIHSGFDYLLKIQAETNARQVAAARAYAGDEAANAVNSYNAVTDTALLSLGEFGVQLPVGVLGVGLMPEQLYNSNIRSDWAQAEQGWDEYNDDKFWLGIARTSGTVGLWAGAASIGMGATKQPWLNEAPISQLFRSENWTPIADPPNSYRVNTGINDGWEYTGPRRLLYDRNGNLITRPTGGDPGPEAFEHDGIGVPATPGARPADSVFYGVVFEAQLTEGVHFPGVDRPQHFAQGNRQLFYELQSDPQLAASLEGQYPGLMQGLAPGPRGAFLDRSPHPLLTWHHEPGVAFPGALLRPRAGRLQLMLLEEHTAPGPVQTSLHPDGRGGMDNWGW